MLFGSTVSRESFLTFVEFRELNTLFVTKLFTRVSLTYSILRLLLSYFTYLSAAWIVRVAGYKFDS